MAGVDRSEGGVMTIHWDLCGHIAGIARNEAGHPVCAECQRHHEERHEANRQRWIDDMSDSLKEGHEAKGLLIFALGLDNEDAYAEAERRAEAWRAKQVW